MEDSDRKLVLNVEVVMGGQRVLMTTDQARKLHRHLTDLFRNEHADRFFTLPDPREAWAQPGWEWFVSDSSDSHGIHATNAHLTIT